MKKVYFLFSIYVLIILLSPFYALAQIKPVLNVPSPDVATLGTYGTIPVSLFTGTPNITIPLHELKVGNFTFPITASYHIGSVKANAQPGIIGLGWSLNTDGYITRTVRGVYDEKRCKKNEHGFYGHAKEIKNIDYNHFADATRNKLQSDIEEDSWYELSPDEFTFNFNGYSGSFYLNEDGGWTVVSEQDIKLEFDAQGSGFVSYKELSKRIPKFDRWRHHDENQRYFNKFTLITPDGCRYVFGGVNATEYSIPYYSRDNSDLVPTTWRLSHISTPEGRNITFTYDTSPILCNIQYSPSASVVYNFSANISYLDNMNTGLKGFNGFISYPVNISKIITEIDTVSFSYQRDFSYGDHFDKGVPLYWENKEARSDTYINIENPYLQFFDLINAHKYGSIGECQKEIANSFVCKYLHRMAIKNVYGGKGKSFYFDYSFKNRRLLTSIVTRSGVPAICYRQAKGEGILYRILTIPENLTDDDMPVWKFTYDSTNMPLSYTLPRTDSEGYYVGGLYTIADPISDAGYPSPNLKNTLACTLKTIQWPTGGFTDFKFELNNYSKQINGCHIGVSDKSGPAPGLRISSITNRNRDGKISSIKKYYYKYDIKSSKSSGVGKEAPKFYVYYFCENGAKLELTSYGGFFPSVTNHVSPIVGYSTVIEETLNKKGASIGYTKYNYTNYSNERTNEPAECCYNMNIDSYLIPFTSISSEVGKLQSMEHFDKDGNRVMKQEYEYDRICNGSIRTPYQQHVIICSDPYHYSDAYIGCIPRVYTFSYVPVKIKTTTWSTFDNSSYSTEKLICYNNHKMESSNSSLQSDGTWLTTKYYYPYDFSTYDWMTNRHVFSPIVKKTESNAECTKNTIYTYDKSLCDNLYIKNITIDKNGTKRSCYDVLLVDPWGNPKEIVENGKHTSLFWMNIPKLLVAKMENYSVLGNGEPKLNYQTRPGTLFATEVFSFTGDGYKSHPESLIHLYTYDNDLNLQTYTAPNFHTLFYEYDALNRLKTVFIKEHRHSMHDRKIVREYRYDLYNNDQNPSSKKK